MLLCNFDGGRAQVDTEGVDSVRGDEGRVAALRSTSMFSFDP